MLAHCRIVFEMRKQLMEQLMKHGLQMSLRSNTLSIENKMVVRAFGHTTKYGRDSPFKVIVSLYVTNQHSLCLQIFW